MAKFWTTSTILNYHPTSSKSKGILYINVFSHIQNMKTIDDELQPVSRKQTTLHNFTGTEIHWKWLSWDASKILNYRPTSSKNNRDPLIKYIQLYAKD